MCPDPVVRLASRFFTCASEGNRELVSGVGLRGNIPTTVMGMRPINAGAESNGIAIKLHGNWGIWQLLARFAVLSLRRNP
ncbi:hypothetical protein MO867_12890 [Microbulbifer sp. OS29]|uniref:Uncharacterized protein n=1 Tax=Microbulbifer okhotskensis TaxID=2926617 RepID=A0A9X2EP48_9GAMM|nr:hypothetical protein [Microbulbifer okhotskensis]MCO1335229.1 hypothetical protein [Microbulbifer okhotskensis]